MKTLTACIFLVLFSATTFGSDKSYSMKDFKELNRLGEKGSVPCPCVWDKKRGRGEDYIHSNDGVNWQCREWKSDGSCESVGKVKSE